MKASPAAPADLSIIIINWKTRALVHQCVKSILAHPAALSREIIVIDNASYDGTADDLRENFPEVRFLQSDENLGFAGANQSAYQHASGRFLFFLNPDTEVRGTAVEDLFWHLDHLPKAGAIGCRLLNGDGTLQTSCIQALPTILNQCLDFAFLQSSFPSRLWGNQPLLNHSASPSAVEMVSGAALMIRRDVFEAVGGFSLAYFMYGEDADLCHKVQAAGWTIYYLPTAEIVHYGGQSSKAVESSATLILKQESLQIYFRKTRGKAYAAMFRVSRIFTSVFRLMAVSLLSAIPAGKKKRASCRNAFRKWLTILRWSLGLAKPQASQFRSRMSDEKLELDANVQKLPLRPF